MAELRRPGLLGRRLVELVRLRVAFPNQCRSCMAVLYRDGTADGVDEGLVCQLASPDEAPDLSDAERSALRFADRMAMNMVDELPERFRSAAGAVVTPWNPVGEPTLCRSGRLDGRCFGLGDQPVRSARLDHPE